MVAVELKRDLDARIQKAAAQVLKYMKLLDPNGDGLAPKIAASYAKAAHQMSQLGFASPQVDAIVSSAPVHGLLALANYNRKSKLLDRARKEARMLGRPLHFCFIGEGEVPVLPSPEKWQKLE